MSVLDRIYEKAKLNPQKVAFPEAANEKMMQAAYETGKEGYIIPILVGDAEELKKLAVERGYDLSVFQFVDINDEAYRDKLIDIYVNIPGMTRAQAEYNKYAPVLMTSVDTDPALCAAERSAIMQRLGAGAWKIFGAHGMMKEYNLRAE